MTPFLIKQLTQQSFIFNRFTILCPEYTLNQGVIVFFL